MCSHRYGPAVKKYLAASFIMAAAALAWPVAALAVQPGELQVVAELPPVSYTHLTLPTTPYV